MKTRFGAAAAAALVVTACGGGDGNSTPPTTGSGGGGTPAPTPTPTPPSYSTFGELTGDQAFASACANSARNSVILPPITTAFGDGFSLNFAEANGNWTVTGNGLDFTFVPDSSAQNTDRTQFFETVPGQGDQGGLVILNRRTNNPFAEYVRFAQILTTRTDGTVEDYNCVFGVTTELSDALPDSVVNYEGLFPESDVFLVDGNIISGSRLREGEIEFSAEPATGAISIGFELTPNSEVLILDGATTIDGSEQSFYGPIVDQANTAVGNFGGWFFGPQGTEVGIVFGFDVIQNDGTRVSAMGAVIGTAPSN